jgi:hypothetical protein
MHGDIHCPQFIREISWAEKKRFAVSLSHDIDYWISGWGLAKVDVFKFNLKTF